MGYPRAERYPWVMSGARSSPFLASDRQAVGHGAGATGDAPDVGPARSLPRLQPPTHHHPLRHDLPAAGPIERLCFGIPGGLCEDCHQLYIDPELIELPGPRRRPLRVRDRERRRAAGGGLVLRRLSVARQASASRERAVHSDGASASPARRHALPIHSANASRRCAVRRPRVRRPLDHRVELQHALERVVELVDRPARGPAPASFCARNGWPPIAFTMSAGRARLRREVRGDRAARGSGDGAGR